MYLPVAASAGALSDHSLVCWDSGTLIAATSTTANEATAGVLRKAVAATDDDYAVARLLPVEVPLENYVTWTADVTATLVVADVGLYCDLTDSLHVSRASSTYDIVQITKYLSTTKAEVILNIGPGGKGTT